MTESSTKQESPMRDTDHQLDIRLTADGVSVDQDLPCCQCDYNLRMQPRDGVCPECGMAVETTIAKRTLMLLNPNWLRTLSRGAWILSYGVPAGLLVFVGFFVLAAMNIIGTKIGIFSIPSFLYWALFFLFGVGLIGVLFFTSPMKTGLGSGRLMWAQRICRVAATIFFLLYCLVLWAAFYLTRRYASIFALVIVVSQSVSVVAFAEYCREIAAMFSESEIVRRCRHYLAFYCIGWLLAAPAMIILDTGTGRFLVAIAILVMGISFIILFGLLILVLPNHLTKKLRQARDEAQAMIETNKAAPVQSSAASV